VELIESFWYASMLLLSLACDRKVVGISKVTCEGHEEHFVELGSANQVIENARRILCSSTDLANAVMWRSP
jgi:hypothetical protein